MEKTKPANLTIESYHLQGARTMLAKLMDCYKFLPKMKSGREDAIYVEAELRCILSSRDNNRHFLSFGFDGMKYRNHTRGKNGKLISVEAYYDKEKETT